jgi:hypothetical protein
VHDRRLARRQAVRRGQYAGIMPSGPEKRKKQSLHVSVTSGTAAGVAECQGRSGFPFTAKRIMVAPLCTGQSGFIYKTQRLDGMSDLWRVV